MHLPCNKPEVFNKSFVFLWVLAETTRETITTSVIIISKTIMPVIRSYLFVVFPKIGAKRQQFVVRLSRNVLCGVP
jgi:hypothetical protein